MNAAENKDILTMRDEVFVEIYWLLKESCDKSPSSNESSFIRDL